MIKSGDHFRQRPILYKCMWNKIIRTRYCRMWNFQIFLIMLYPCLLDTKFADLLDVRILGAQPRWTVHYWRSLTVLDDAIKYLRIATAYHKHWLHLTVLLITRFCLLWMLFGTIAWFFKSLISSSHSRVSCYLNKVSITHLLTTKVKLNRLTELKNIHLWRQVSCEGPNTRWFSDLLCAGKFGWFCSPYIEKLWLCSKLHLAPHFIELYRFRIGFMAFYSMVISIFLLLNALFRFTICFALRGGSEVQNIRCFLNITTSWSWKLKNKS